LIEIKIKIEIEEIRKSN